MDDATKRFFDRSARSLIILGPLIGVVDLIGDYRNHHYRDAIVVICLYFIVVPIFSFWWSRKHPK